jgi:FAD-linked oxidoreductase
MVFLPSVNIDLKARACTKPRAEFCPRNWTGVPLKIVGGKWSNWSGRVTCKPREIVAPRDEVELAAAVRQARAPLRVPGTGHSFTPLNATDGTLIDLAAFTGVRGADPALETATIAAGAALWDIGPALCSLGFAFRNQGDIDRQTLGGVVATGTHGTGLTLGSFSADVAGFRLMPATGEVIDCTPTENAEIFAAGRLALGLFGVMTEISMRVRPAYKLVEKHFLMSSEEVLKELDRLVSANRHFEFFWFPYADNVVCKTLNETDEDAPAPRGSEELYRRGETAGFDARAFAAICAVLPYAPFLLKTVHRFFSDEMPATTRVRWSHEAFPSPRLVRFNEMEYAVPYERAKDCLCELVDLIRRKRINTGFPLEFRTVAADDVWLSPFYARPSATIAVHQFHTVDPTALFRACEAVFRRYEGRPHWGKVHSRTAKELEALYPKYGEFLALRRRVDPTNRFLNHYLRDIFP